MGLVSRVRSLADRAAMEMSDGSWAIPLAAYRLSGRRIGPASELYRAGVLRQRFYRARLPGMTTETERAYFRWHAQEKFSGHGAIVDLGSWFGSTTATLAMGLCRNPRSAAQHAKIHAFDRFTWESWMEPYVGAPRLGSYAPMDSFLQEFDRVVKPWRHRIDVHVGDLLEQTWRKGPIEVLLVDAMKSWDLTSRIVSEFFAALAPPDAYVIHQDFGHCFTPWIHLVSYRLRGHLVPIHDVVRSETVVFRLARSFEDDADALRVDRTAFDDAEVREAFEYSLHITRPDKHSGINAARVMLLLHDGDAQGGMELLRLLERKGRVSEFHAEAVRAAIDGATSEN